MRRIFDHGADEDYGLADDTLDEIAGDFCAYCGCTKDNACLLGGDLPFCSWHRQVDTARGRFSVCSTPECVQRYLADASAP